MKFKKQSKAIAATTRMIEKSHSTQTVLNKKDLFELARLISIVLGLGLWIKCCMAMKDPIFIQKSLACSFVIILILCLQKTTGFKRPQ